MWLSYTRFRALLSREGYRWKEPKYDLSHLQDRPAQETAEQVQEWLKKHLLYPAAEVHLLIVDETTLSLHPTLRRCWMKRGQRRLIPGAEPSEYLHVFGAYDWVSSFVLYDRGAQEQRLPHHVPGTSTS